MGLADILKRDVGTLNVAFANMRCTYNYSVHPRHSEHSDAREARDVPCLSCRNTGVGIRLFLCKKHILFALERCGLPHPPEV